MNGFVDDSYHFSWLPIIITAIVMLFVILGVGILVRDQIQMDKFCDSKDMEFKQIDRSYYCLKNDSLYQMIKVDGKYKLVKEVVKLE